MPRIECRPDQVFPELLEARLLISGELPVSLGGRGWTTKLWHLHKAYLRFQ